MPMRTSFEPVRRAASACPTSIIALAIPISCMASADPRQRIVCEHVHDPGSPQGSAHREQAGVLASDFAYPACAPSQWMSLHCIQQALGIFRSADREKLPLIRNVKRIEPQQLAGSAHLVTQGNSLFFQLDAN